MFHPGISPLLFQILYPSPRTNRIRIRGLCPTYDFNSQIRPLLIILLASPALLNSIITLEAAFVGALRVSHLTYLISA